MNERVYNEDISSFKNKVNAHEQAIIDGSKVARELNEFIELHKELEGILDDYINLTVNDSNYMERLESYLKEELDYLNLISSLMDDLDKHHDSLGTIDAYTISKEWEDVKYLVTISNLERSMIRLQYLKQNYPESFNQDLYNEMERKYYEIGLRALDAQENMMNIMEENEALENDIEEEFTAGETPQDDSKDEEKNPLVIPENDLLINESLLEQMEVDEQIKYFEKVVQNIENVRGKSKLVYVNGEKKKIAKKYAARYSGYVARLNNLYNKDIIDEQNMINQISNILNNQADLEKTEFILENEAAVEKYCAIREEMDEIYKQEAQFILRASGRPLTEIVEQKMLDGKPGFILMEDVLAYDELVGRATALQTEFDEIMFKYGITPNNNITKGEPLDPKERKKEILNQIYFLMYNGERSENLDKEIKALMDEYRSLETHKKLNKLYKLRKFFRLEGFKPEDCKYLAQISLDPEDLQNNKSISDEKKNNILTTILNKLKKNEVKEEEQKQDEKMSFVEKTKMNAWKCFGGTLGVLYATGLDIQDAYKNVTKAVKSIPTKAKGFVSKIKGTRKPINKHYLKEEIKIRGTRLAIVAGFGIMLYAGAMSHGKGQNNNYTGPVDNETTYETEVEEDTTLEDIADQMGTEIADRVEPSPEPGVDNNVDNVVEDTTNEEVEQNGVYIGDVFTIEANSPIYTNMYDAANENNGLNPYFADDSKREVTGIAYEYNGTMVMLDMNDPDFEAKKTALESNGAVPVAVRSENEASKGIEGYYNLDDVEIELGGR